MYVCVVIRHLFNVHVSCLISYRAIGQIRGRLIPSHHRHFYYETQWHKSRRRSRHFHYHYRHRHHSHHQQQQQQQQQYILSSVLMICCTVSLENAVHINCVRILTSNRCLLAISTVCDYYAHVYSCSSTVTMLLFVLYILIAYLTTHEAAWYVILVVSVCFFACLSVRR